MSDERCETCRFSYMLSDDLARCRRFPPVLVLGCSWTDVDSWVQPPVSLDDWCGEYQPRPDAVSNEVVDRPPPVGSN